MYYLCAFYIQGVKKPKNTLSTAQTVLARLHEDRVYPPVQTYKMNMIYTIQSTPPGFNGSKGEPVTFRWANPLEVAVALLQKSSLHNNDEDNFCLDPEMVIDNNGRRLFTRDIYSGNWWPR